MLIANTTKGFRERLRMAALVYIWEPSFPLVTNSSVGLFLKLPREGVQHALQQT